MSNNFDDIFEPAPQAEDFDKEAWAAKKKAERDEVYALADATAEEVCADGGKFREYLDVQANFRHYSATNALLILAAKPDARRLGDKDFWRDQGVYIKRQEFGHPIKIVESNGEYTRDDGSIGVSYNIKHVYDISQTTSRMRAQPPVSHDARALLGALIYKKPVPIQSVDELPDGLGALYDHEQEAIFVCRGMEANDLFCEVSKALAQAELAQTGEEYDPQTASFKAHCVSYILGKEFGVDVSDYSFENPLIFSAPTIRRKSAPSFPKSEIPPTTFPHEWQERWKKKNRPAIRNRSAEYGKNRKTSADPRPLRTWRCYQCP